MYGNVWHFIIFMIKKIEPNSIRIFFSILFFISQWKQKHIIITTAVIIHTTNIVKHNSSHFYDTIPFKTAHRRHQHKIFCLPCLWGHLSNEIFGIMNTSKLKPCRKWCHYYQRNRFFYLAKIRDFGYHSLMNEIQLL